MSDDFTPGAHELVRDAGQRARSLGHNWVGFEHLLLALAANDGPVEKVLFGTVGRGRGQGLFDTLDREALASVAIDLDTVRETIECSFGPTAFRPPRARPPRRFAPRFPPRFARRLRCPGLFTKRARSYLKSTVRAARSDLGLVTVKRLALRLVMMNDPTVSKIFTELGVSSAHLVEDLLNVPHRTS
jgi:hypothetical protein